MLLYESHLKSCHNKRHAPHSHIKTIQPSNSHYVRNSYSEDGGDYDANNQHLFENSNWSASSSNVDPPQP